MKNVTLNNHTVEEIELGQFLQPTQLREWIQEPKAYVYVVEHMEHTNNMIDIHTILKSTVLLVEFRAYDIHKF